MRALRRLLILAATAFVVAVLVLDVLSIVGWPDGGPIALAQVLAAHLTIVALVVDPGRLPPRGGDPARRRSSPSRS